MERLAELLKSQPQTEDETREMSRVNVDSYRVQTCTVRLTHRRRLPREMEQK